MQRKPTALHSRSRNLCLLLFLSPAASTFTSLQSLPSESPPSPPPLHPRTTTTTAISHPLPSLLPIFLNPHNTTVDLICSRLKRCERDHQLDDGDDGHHAYAFLDAERESHLLPYLGHREISRVLLRSQSLPIPSLAFFHWAESHHLGPHAPLNYCILVHILTSSRYFSRALHVLNGLLRTHARHDAFASLLSSTQTCSCNWDPAVFGMLIKAYVKLGRLQESLDACRRAMDSGFSPDTDAFNCLLRALANSNCVQQCWAIYEEMRRRAGAAPNTRTFNIMTHALCRGGDASKAREFLEEMESEGFDPDVVTYNTLIDGYCRKERIDDALGLFRIMHLRGVEPDVISYTILMTGLCREGRVLEAHQLFDKMLRRGLTLPDTCAYNALVAGYCKEGRMREARLLLISMIQCGLMPDDFTCAVIVEGFVKCGKLLSCLNITALLRKLEIGIPLNVYKSLTDALCKEKRPHAARNLLNWMIQDGLGPDLETYNAIIDALCDCDLIAEAIEMKNDMISCKGISPDLLTYQLLIGCLCRLGKSIDGEQLMAEMIEYDLVPDSVISSALVARYCEERDFSKAESLLSYFAEKLSVYDSRGFNAIMRVYCEGNNMVMKALEFQDRMVKLGFVPTSDTCKLLIHGFSSNRCHG